MSELDQHRQNKSAESIFNALQKQRQQQPLTAMELVDQRQFCQWRIDVLKEKVSTPLYGTNKDAVVQYEREQLASYIREVRNWPPEQWRTFVDQDGIEPLHTNPKIQQEVENHIQKLRHDTQLETLEDRLELESNIFNLRHISIKEWKEIPAITELVHETLNSPLQDGLKKLFENEALLNLAKIKTAVTHRQQPDQARPVIEWAKDQGYLNDIEAASMKNNSFLPKPSGCFKGI